MLSYRFSMPAPSNTLNSPLAWLILRGQLPSTIMLMLNMFTLSSSCKTSPSSVLTRRGDNPLSATSQLAKDLMNSTHGGNSPCFLQILAFCSAVTSLVLLAFRVSQVFDWPMLFYWRRKFVTCLSMNCHAIFSWQFVDASFKVWC